MSKKRKFVYSLIRAQYCVQCGHNIKFQSYCDQCLIEYKPIGELKEKVIWAVVSGPLNELESRIDSVFKGE